MPGIDGPVCLTHSSPDNSYAGQLLVYDVVPASIVPRSGVLLSIAEAQCDAQLPDVLTLSDFKTWSKVAADGQDQPQCTDMVHACTVLKVSPCRDPCSNSHTRQDTACRELRRATLYR